MSGFSDRMRSLFGKRDATSADSGGNAPAAASQGESPAPPAAGDDVMEVLRRKLVELSEGKVEYEQVDPSVSILDYGYVDSLSSVKLLGFVEETYGVEIPETELVGRANSLEGIAEFVARARP